jgi:hypothetical protein
MSGCFTHVFDKSKTEYTNWTAANDETELFKSFLSNNDIYGFIHNGDAPPDTEAIDIAKRLDADMYSRYLHANIGKKLLGYDGGFPSENASYNNLDSRHCMMSIVLFKHIPIPIRHIVEIGGGYGNWLRLNYSLQSFEKWSIVDLDHVGRLQRWCLTQWSIPDSVYDIVSSNDTPRLQHADVVIGAHSLSEFSYDTFKFYFDTVLVNAKYLFYAYHRTSPSEGLIRAKNALLTTAFDLVVAIPSQEGAVFNCVLKNKTITT